MARFEVSALTRAVLATGFIALASLYSVGAERFSCPDNLSEGGGAYQDGSSSVEYRSWGWEKDEKHYLCHCVRNLHRNPVRISWPDVGLAGWVRLNASVYAMSSTADGNYETRETELKLGGVSLQVNTLFHREAGHSEIERPATVRLASADLVAQAEPYPTSSSIEVSEARIAVPAMQLLGGLNLEEIEAMVQGDPDLLQDVEMTFTSEASSEDSVIHYECRYGVANPSTDSSFLLQIDDPEVHMAIFGRPEAQYVDWSRFGHRGDVVMRGELRLSGITAADLVTRSTTMNFLSDSGTVLGSMPIRFLALP